ncbi:DUF4328 domain-containing protein [Streptomyces profundus]|nr:DUF4328 domain-containing protein [Streptomyces sp. MA3_2.13]
MLGWFIPVVNLYLPKQIANDVWHASRRPARAAHEPDQPRRARARIASTVADFASA